MNVPQKHTFLRFLSGTSGLQHSLFIKIVIGLAVTLVITFLFPSTESIEYTYAVGAVWTQKDLIATFSFPILKDVKEFERERQLAVAGVYPVVRRERAIESANAETLSVWMSRLVAAGQVRRRLTKKSTKEDTARVISLVQFLPFHVSGNDWNVLQDPSGLSAIETTVQSAVKGLYEEGILDVESLRNPGQLFALRSGNSEETVPAERFYGIREARAKLAGMIRAEFGESQQTLLSTKIAQALLDPNIRYDPIETDNSQRVAAEMVPKTLGFVQENERIVGKHERITPEIKSKLDSFRRAKAERGTEHSMWSQRVGMFFHVGLIILLYSLYLFFFRKKIFHDNATLTLISLLILMVSFTAYLTIVLDVAMPVHYLIIVPAASMLLTILFDSRVAFYGTVTVAFLIAGIRGNDYSIALASLIAGTLSAYTVRDIKNRTQIFRSLGFIMLGYTGVIIALGLERFETGAVMGVELIFALSNAIISPVLTYGLLIFFERVFNVTTDLTLLELSDFNHPLLRKLSEEAPGSFHHSMTLGNLAEAAAEAIGANSILARVGAYYHDVGKIQKPEYFVENQSNQINRHARLRPRMSALIIISHVKEGMELARSFGLPEKVVDFIPQHHGTTMVSYFYDKAVRQAAVRKNAKDPSVSETDFRYPGPKPQTKETGIVMLADSVEAYSRSIDDLTAPKLEAAIENMIRQRFMDGQLDECDLTLRDLTRIKEAFFKILTGIHHQRIKYPEQTSQPVFTAGDSALSESPSESIPHDGEQDSGEPRDPEIPPSRPTP